MMARLGVLLVVMALAADCGGSAGSESGSADGIGGPPGREEEGIARRNTPEGEAAIELVVEPREISLGETVTIHLVNRGEVPLLTGLPFGVERWDGRRWVDVPWPENVVFPLIGIILRPGGSTNLQKWPTDGVQAEPGWYRAVKRALYEDPKHIRPNIELQARTRFHVRGIGGTDGP